MLRKFLLFTLAVLQLIVSFCIPAGAETTGEPVTETIEVIPSDQTVTTLGRTYYQEDGLHFNWTNSGFAFTFTGTAVSMEITASSTFNNAILVVYVDDVALEKPIILSNRTYTVTLVEGLEDSQHTVRVIKRTENGWGGMVTVSKLLVTGTMGAPPAKPDRVIEVVGDSISCGYGNLATDRVLNAYQSTRQDGTKTFATLAAEQFGAWCNVVAKSGIGFGCNNGGGKTDTMLDAYVYTDYFNLGTDVLWDFENNQPDVVIIALGTNDTANADSTDYYNKAKSMLALVREKNPDAYIIWAYEIMTASRSDVLMQVCNEAYEAGDTKVFYHRLGMMNTAADGTGDAGHPSMATHEKDSVALADLITEVTGWNRVGEPAIAYGDINNDQSVNAGDALLVLQSAVNKVVLSETQTIAADVSNDGAVDAKDALLILQKAVDKIEKFPVEPD